MLRILITIFTILAISGCAAGYPGLRDANTQGLSSLEIGMPKQQVLSIMGNKGFGMIDNPARKEQFAIGNDVYEVLYYYTTFIQPGQPMDSGYTPVILKNGVFTGSGREYLFKIR